MNDPSSTTTPPGVAAGIALDVQNLDQSCEFWSRCFGFEVVARRHEGLIIESRDLVSPLFPGLMVSMRSSMPRPIGGSALGTLRRIIFVVGNVERFAAERLSGVKLVAPTGGDSPPTSRWLEDPNRYLIELRDDPRAGS